MEVKDNETIGLKSIIVKYLFHWKLFLGAFLFSLVIAILYLVFYPTTYEMIGSVQLQEEKSIGAGSIGTGDASGIMKSFGLGGMPGSSINMDDELAKFMSIDLMEKMILQLGINVKYVKPWAYNYYMYDNVPIALTPDTVTNKKLRTYVEFDVDIKNDGHIVVKTDVNKKRNKFEFSSLPARIELPEGGFTLSYKNDVVKPYSVVIEVQPAVWMAESMINEFNIEEFSKTSKVVEFTYQDYEKSRGEDIINTLISTYNEEENRFKIKTGKATLTFLDERIKSVMNDLTQLEVQIENYKMKNKMTDLEYDLMFYVDQMKELQIKIIEAEAQYRLIDLVSTYVNDPANKYKLIPTMSATSSDKGSDSNPVSLFNAALLEKERLLQASKVDNPLLNSINTQIEQLRQGVYLSIENSRKSIDMTISDLKYKESQILSKMEDVPLMEREFFDYKRQQEILQGMYLILLQKREETQLSVSDVQDKARVITAAYAKENPVAPRKLFAAIAIFFLTILLPMGYLFMKGQVENFIKEFRKY